MNNHIEILSPCGGPDSVTAAVRSGADAVYLGAKRFSARAGAHNFSEEELRDCVRCCHVRGVKVYLTLNTLIFDDEMEAALDLLKTAAKADIDAVIIQDLGLVSLVKKAIPDLPLHASTQMSVHTPYGAKALYELGFKRVVVSRELSLKEIEEIHAFCPQVELEVFVHGALCMCVSGQCYFSAMLGGRSANRGMCAQPCRLPMQFCDNDHALSLKDNGSLHYLRELERIGVRSAKIEGRMKRPEYVAAATAAAYEARENGTVSANTQQRLRSVFSRTGFTDGYLSGRLGKEMFGFRRKDDVTAADSKLLKELRSAYKDERQTVGIDLSLYLHTGEKPRLTASDGVHTVTVEGDSLAERAVNLPLREERAAQNLKKTGGTPYRVDSITCDLDDGVIIPAAALNALRREALDSLSEQRAGWHHYVINDIKIEDELCGSTEHAENRVCTLSEEYPADAEDFGRVYIALDRIGEGLPDGRSERIGVEAPRVTFDESAVVTKLQALKAKGARHLIAHNIASVYYGKELGYTVHGGFGLNITNSWALRFFRDYGVIDAELSPELDLTRIKKLHRAIPIGVIRYGYLPLMITRNAPAGKADSCKNNAFLQDRKNERFRILPRKDSYEILNCVPILMPQEDYHDLAGVFHVIRFSVENSVENMEKTLEKIRENRGFERFTHGLYHRGVKNFTIF